MNEDLEFSPSETPDEVWRERLTSAEYSVLRLAGTEAPWSGEYVDCYDEGKYTCRACGHELFSSQTKYSSGCGWPSFFETIETDAVRLLRDTSHGMDRTEVRCAACDSHLGHVFTDGPRPTGLRYCMNSISLTLVPEAEASTGD